MVERVALSKGDFEIARMLWSIGSASVRTIHAAITSDREMDLSTVQTYLRRLEKKRYASSRLDGRLRIYNAKTRPITVIRQAVDDLVDRLFGDDAMPLVRHLIEDRGIEADDLDDWQCQFRLRVEACHYSSIKHCLGHGAFNASS